MAKGQKRDREGFAIAPGAELFNRGAETLTFGPSSHTKSARCFKDSRAVLVENLQRERAEGGWWHFVHR